MKFGFSLLLWTVSIQPRHAPIFARLGEIGYDGAEVPVGMGAPADFDEVKRYADDAGLSCTACALVTPDTDPSSADASVRRAALDYLNSRVECAAVLGSSVLVGPLYAAHKNFSEPPPSADARARAAEVLVQVAENAEAAGLTLCLEPLNRFEIQLVNTCEDARRIVDLADCSHLAVHYDSHHGHIEEQSHASALAACGPHLGHVQLSESHRGTLSSGQVDWPALAQALQAVEYDGWIVAECFGTAVEHLSSAACVHRNCFESRDQLMQSSLPFMADLLGC
ncbi:MAG: sugar phosphate isomerase/epimerase family protein [bacterium]|jgi:D-psicose/D-tagatose/L-ribulose 3-epimerase|nr:sugar phosphate isomerase/epimerase [Planctomycetota bacterium]HIL52941.1 sugar phosphate isomerase/epimerase [Planctomycetota bacterium]